MKYKFLHAWAEEQKIKNNFFRSVMRWRDQYAIIFNKEEYLQVNLQSANPFCFFTTDSTISWQVAPELAIMQKHLERAKLKNISIIDNERIIYLDFIKPDPFKQQEFRLILELIPQFTNIVLTIKEEDSYKIIDCSRKVSLAENHYRQLIPAVKYELPPSGYTNDTSPIELPLGFDDKLKVIEKVQDGCNSLNEFMENYYYQGYLQKIIEQTKREKLKKINNEIKKKKRKLAKQEKELTVAEAAEKWKQQGELLKAQLHQIKIGMEEIELINYYDENLPKIKIKLKPDKSPLWNADYYFKKYRKSLNGLKIIEKQIKSTSREIDQLIVRIEEIKDLNVVLPGEFNLPQTAQIDISEKLTRIKVDDNWEFVIGRNSKQNDYITTRLAKSYDWWFHTRVFKGTHILLRNLTKKDLPENLLEIGCRLAAAYSKASKSSNVPVDYTQIRYVRKPRNAAPGYVIYTHQKTLYVDPLDIRAAGKLIKSIYG